jgi:hypothetical protein
VRREAFLIPDSGCREEWRQQGLLNGQNTDCDSIASEKRERVVYSKQIRI